MHQYINGADERQSIPRSESRVCEQAFSFSMVIPKTYQLIRVIISIGYFRMQSQVFTLLLITLLLSYFRCFGVRNHGDSEEPLDSYAALPRLQWQV